MSHAADWLSAARRPELEAALLAYVPARRWFRAKSRSLRGAAVVDLVPLPRGDRANATEGPVVVAVVQLRYDSGEPDRYVVPLASADDAALAALAASHPHAIVSREAGLIDALVTGQAAGALLAVARDGRAVRGDAGTLRGETSEVFADVAGTEPLAAKVSQGEQSNSTVLFGERLLLKVYRQLSPGPNPEIEVGRFLTRHAGGHGTPRVLASLTYVGDEGGAFSVGVVHEFVANEGDAWSLALRELRADLGAKSGPPTEGAAAVGRFQGLAATLGRRTGALHLALASDSGDPDFAPEPLTSDDRATLVARAGEMLDGTLATLSGGELARRLPAEVKALVGALSAPRGRQAVAALLHQFRDQPLDVVKTRTHGDLHLGQVLSRGDDFVIIDFEGEPARPLHERRAKGSPLRDVMGMIRSFDYGAATVLRDPNRTDVAHAGAWATLWVRQVTDGFVRAYLETVAGAPFLPALATELTLMMTFYELEKVIYEVAYEANNRPDWVGIPLAGLARIAAVGGDS